MLQDIDPSDLASSVPREYLDGCTMFPDRLGKISHKHVCVAHDIEYWFNRTVLGKVKADLRWAIGINNAHKTNKLYWRVFALISSLVGFIALSTVGWFFWKNKDSWENKNGKTN